MPEAVIVGAGHNGLVAAFYLTRAGFRVHVVEALAEVGGACKTEELIPGYRFSTCANYLGWLRPRVAEDMQLFERGVDVIGGHPATRILEGDRPFVSWPEDAMLKDEIARYSVVDCEGWNRWEDFWRRAANLLGPYLLSYPPLPSELFRRAGELGEAELLDRLFTASLAEIVDSFFASPELRSCVSAPHDIGSHWDAGSGLVMGLAAAMAMYSETGEPIKAGYVRGGMGKIAEVMAKVVQREGVVIQTSAPVKCVNVEAGRVVGVTLESGDFVSSDIVMVSTDPIRTFTELVDSIDVPTTFIEGIRRLKTRVAPLKFHCAMSELPEFAAFGDSELPTRGPLTICPSRDHFERAWNDASNGRLPEEPFVVMMTPSAWDRSLAPPDHHTVSCWILFAPVRPAQGTWTGRRDEMTERLVQLISRYSPNFVQAMIDCVLLTPSDLEERVLLKAGNIHHVDITASQCLWQRPMAELARYRTPVEGLYMCGAGQHPYGEVSGGPGHNAAHAVLEDLGVLDPGSWEERLQRDGVATRLSSRAGR